MTRDEYKAMKCRKMLDKVIAANEVNLEVLLFVLQSFSDTDCKLAAHYELTSAAAALCQYQMIGKPVLDGVGSTTGALIRHRAKYFGVSL